ncbi:Uncharacterised protein [Cedecea neteri]|uniref:Uncharacterized protein n=1 Tax=Cedecea neteri TaxID=158822 RepID=A0A2X2VC00_9ENTR|nr:Uncharacterised protein [Cedecea neteri]
MLAVEVLSFHVATRMARFRRAHNSPVREGDFTVRTAANAKIVAKAPVVQVVLALVAWFRIGGGFILLVACGGEQLVALLENIPQRVVIRQLRRA